MNRSILIALAMFPLASFATDQFNNDSNTQSNQSVTSNSGSLQNYQINNDSEARHRIGDVECAAPTVDVGLADREGAGNSAMLFASVSIPLSSGACKKAQETRLRRMQLNLDVASIEQAKKDEMFVGQMEKNRRAAAQLAVENQRKEIMFKEKLTRICESLKGSKHHMLLEECHGNPKGKHNG